MCAWSIAFWESNIEECCRQLERDCMWKSIPLLNHVHQDEPLNERLVRFRGMIQDMYNPELYLSQYEVVNKGSGCSSVRSGKYKDSIDWETNEEFIHDSSQNIHSERQTLYCVPVPGINRWVSSLEQEVNSNSGGNQEVQNTTSSEACAPECSEPSAAKRLCVDESSKRPHCGKPLDVNSASADQDVSACLVKVYDKEKFSLNDVIEVVGFLSGNLVIGGDLPLTHHSEVAEMMDDDRDAVNIGVPRLHCIAVRKLTHCNPLLPVATEQSTVFESAESVRQELKLVLSHLLCGDVLAADYLLCHLLSCVYLRNNSMALGKMSLNITSVPANCSYANNLYNVLSLLLPKSHFVPMTLDNLNKLVFVPKKDYSVNKLKTGILQLSNHTHLILDETQLMPGQLDARGVQNVTALGMVMRHQKLDYDFKYYTLEFETDIPILVLSEGKSLLPSDIVIPLRADNGHVAEMFEAAAHYLKEPLLGKIRVYLTTMMQANFTVPSSMEEVIQHDFVEMRKMDSKFTPDDLHNLLVLARLISLSKGSQELTETSWKYAVEMECQRKQR